MSNFNKFFGASMDAHQVIADNSTSNYVTVEEGEYKVYIDHFDEIENNEKGQSGVAYTYIIQGGKYDGWSVRDQFLFVQQNEVGVKMSFTGFADLALSCGFDKPTGFEQMIGKTIIIEMKKSKDGKYVNVSRRLPYNQTTPTATVASTAPEAKKMPWAK